MDLFTHNPIIYDTEKTWRPFIQPLTHDIRRGYSYTADPISRTIDITSVYPAAIYTDNWGVVHKNYESLEQEKEAMKDVEIISKKSSDKNECITICKNLEDLSVTRILQTLSAVKGRLMLDLSPKKVVKLECSMTPLIKQNIITASKKLKMYGKTRPIVARFDDWGNRLPDEINLGTSEGITLKIVDPEEYGEFYLELRATTEEARIDWTYTDLDTLPF